MGLEAAGVGCGAGSSLRHLDLYPVPEPAHRSDQRSTCHDQFHLQCCDACCFDACCTVAVMHVALCCVLLLRDNSRGGSVAERPPGDSQF